MSHFWTRSQMTKGHKTVQKAKNERRLQHPEKLRDCGESGSIKRTKKINEPGVAVHSSSPRTQVVRQRQTEEYTGFFIYKASLGYMSPVKRKTRKEQKYTSLPGIS